MSSVPSEVLRDVLLPLNRWALDDIQFTSRRFLQLILERMSDVCLRKIGDAAFRAPNDNTDGSSYAIHIYGRPTISNTRTVTQGSAHFFSEFVQALRSSRVAHLALNCKARLHAATWTLVLQTPIVARELSLSASNCAQMTPTQFQEVVRHFSPTSLFLSSCYFRACQLTDELVRALSKSRVRTWFPRTAPVDGGRFSVTDDAVVDFCMQGDAQLTEEGVESLSSLDLSLHFGTFTKDLFKRLVEASSVYKRTQPLRIVVSPVRIVEEDLRDFAQHLSYRYRGTPHQERIYDFPGEQQGADDAMDLQILLRPENRLELIRARRPNKYYFYESNE